MSMPHWPYPRWIAHRGAGRFAPENTLAAFRFGASHGYRMFACDVKLSKDDVPFLMHDAELNRTTNGTGVAGEKPWSELSQFDAGSWHGRAWAGEPLPAFEAIARYCLANRFFLDIEIKPTPGTEEHTGRVVAEHTARLWKNQAVQPFFTSFRPESLLGAKTVAPHIPRGLLVDKPWDGWFDYAQQLECAAVVCNHKLVDEAYLAKLRAAGMRALVYTVNEQEIADRLIALDIDGIVTDRVDLFIPD